ncbi:hypothetical protein CspeluHIS016_0504810 [Cutaneotrichosporon spelunceum]|uniref:SUZ domain-containing protein n=1 Tax=Cutaneotrichosporon spelunceum TaxID=1672016 RepID=A0AAD3YDZ1_9TREE|nr:hypothetical protein CspeluHIS016_0504810 [Cutaneotrichosporon spelunceum]
MDDWETDDFEPKRVLRAPRTSAPASASASVPVSVSASSMTNPPLPAPSGPSLPAPTPEGSRPILLARRPAAAPHGQPAHPAQPGHHSHPVQLLHPGVAPETPPDDEDDWFRGAPVSNRQIWDSANHPAVLMTAPSAPPPKLQILKRDAPPRSASGSSSGAATPKTLAQREEEYRLARERIFGKDKDEVPSSSASASSTTSAGSAPQCERGSGNGDRRSNRGGRRSGTSTPSGRNTPAADELSRAVAQLTIRPGMPGGGGGDVGGAGVVGGGGTGSEFDRGFDKLDARRQGQAYAGRPYAQSYANQTYSAQGYSRDGYSRETYSSQTYSNQNQGYQSYQSQSFQHGLQYRYSAYEAQTFGPRYAPSQAAQAQHARPQSCAQPYYNAQYVPTPHAPSAHSSQPGHAHAQPPIPQVLPAATHSQLPQAPPHAQYAPQAQNSAAQYTAPSQIPPCAYGSGTPPVATTGQRPTPPVPPIQQRSAGGGGGGVLRQPRGPGQGGFGRPV